MLRTNLSTRPFYNERAVHVGIVVAALLVLAITALNVDRLDSLYFVLPVAHLVLSRLLIAAPA